jgi:hypothetical protein
MLSGVGRGRVRNFSSASIFAMGLTALSATILHGIEGFIWAGAYHLVGALHDNKSAMLYLSGSPHAQSMPQLLVTIPESIHYLSIAILCGGSHSIPT